MTRNLKTLGLALVAAMALSAVVASAASAAPASFTATVGANEQAEIHGEQIGVDTFQIGALPALTCAVARETGKPEENGVHKKGPSAPSVTLTPFYETCHVVAFGITKIATVTVNGCSYTFTATKNTNSPTGVNTPFSADLTINCPTKPIEIHIYDSAAKHAANEPLCTYDVGNQSHNNQIQLTNNAAPNPDDVVADINISGVAVHNTIFGILCGNTTNPTAVYKGTHTLRATNGISQFVHSTVS